MARSQICTDVLFLCLHLALSGFGSVRLCYFVSVCLSVCPTVSFSLSIYPHFLSLSLTLHHLSPTDTHQPVPDYPSVSIPAHPPSSFSLPLIHSFSLCLPPSIHLQLLSLVLGEDTATGIKMRIRKDIKMSTGAIRVLASRARATKG